MFFLAFCYFIGFRLILIMLRWIDDHAYVEYATLTAMVGLAFVCAIITQAIGIHAVFGAFIGGVMLAQSARMRKADQEQLRAVTICARLAPERSRPRFELWQ